MENVQALGGSVLLVCQCKENCILTVCSKQRKLLWESGLQTENIFDQRYIVPKPGVDIA